MIDGLRWEPVPSIGPLSIGETYRRADLHVRFGGSRFSGIVPSKREPVVLLFHTEEPTQQFYRDGFDSDGVYWYSAEGSSGDMTWTPANRAVRNHAELGLDLLFFERAQRKDGLWRLSQIFYYLSHKRDPRIDKSGNSRSAIVFGLLPVTTNSIIQQAQGVAVPLNELRAAILDPINLTPGGIPEVIRNIYLRSEAVRRYALQRAAGTCEACKTRAPFISQSGEPFLEVHHIDRLADNGPDRVDRVAAVCPNCHRRCHYSSDRLQFNAELRSYISSREHDRVKSD
jgi:5-methylcytosine-specific restriction protein A